MSARLFGTDGVRGRWPEHPLSAAVARALGVALRQHYGEAPVAIARDTRASGPALRAALLSGLGGEVLDLGVLPTPGVSALLEAGHGHVGVMLTASHNPWRDNGLKVLGPRGGKLSVEEELALEARLQAALAARPPSAPPRVRSLNAAPIYLDALREALPPGLRLDGVKLALDAANGAAWRTAPRLLRSLGAELVLSGVSPSGENINEGVGALHPQALGEQVRAQGCAAGIALDGDGDRCTLVDAAGQVVDGDGLLLLLARGPGLVGTVMCNAALERSLAARGLRFERVGVGDRQVATRMKALGWPVGGEPSGHVLLADGLPTGDGLLTGLRALAGGLDLAGRLADWRPDPAATRNIAVTHKPPFEEVPGLQDAIAAADAAGCRVLVRYSGTEPKLRVLVEAPLLADAERYAAGVSALVVAAIGRA